MPEITLRDHFAGLALAGILSCHRVAGTDQEQAKAAYALADAMLEARGQQNAEEKACVWHRIGSGWLTRDCDKGGAMREAHMENYCPKCGGRIVVKGENSECVIANA